MQIGVMPTSSDTDISGFQVGAGYTVETTKEQAAVWIADAVQTELAGYEFVQWPIDGPRLLRPMLRRGEAQWRDADGTAVALIGELCAG